MENLDAFLDRRNYFYCSVIVERYRAAKAFLPTEYSNVSFSRNLQIFSLKEEYASIDYICRLTVEKRYPSFRIDKQRGKLDFKASANSIGLPRWVELFRNGSNGVVGGTENREIRAPFIRDCSIETRFTRFFQSRHEPEVLSLTFLFFTKSGNPSFCKGAEARFTRL